MKVRNWEGAETPIIKLNSEMNANAFIINYLESRWCSIIKSTSKEKKTMQMHGFRRINKNMGRNSRFRDVTDQVRE